MNIILTNMERYRLYTSSNNCWINGKLKQFLWSGTRCMRGTKNAYRILAGKYEGVLGTKD
jgi:hypothetical protein